MATTTQDLERELAMVNLLASYKMQKAVDDEFVADPESQLLSTAAGK